MIKIYFFLNCVINLFIRSVDWLLGLGLENYLIIDEIFVIVKNGMKREKFKIISRFVMR